MTPAYRLYQINFGHGYATIVALDAVQAAAQARIVQADYESSIVRTLLVPDFMRSPRENAAVAYANRVL